MKTLIIIDAQNDFMPGGALEVPDGDEIIPIINQLSKNFDLVVATQDWHPPHHSSFASNHDKQEQMDTIKWKGLEQMLWPDHCVQNSSGANFHENLNTKPIQAIFRKGMHPDYDSYSGFFDNGHKVSTGLAGYLNEKKADELYFCGLAADVCVYYSLKDALDLAYDVTLIEDATRPLKKEDFETQKQELKSRGLKIISSEKLG